MQHLQPEAVTSQGGGISFLQPQTEELKIQTPYGLLSGKINGHSLGQAIVIMVMVFISVKVWGPSTEDSCFTWLAVHGLQDNLGSFERLAGRFPKNHRIIGFDLPGNGLSSHYPQGFQYCHADILLTFRRLTAHFQLKRYGLIGHSMGGGAAHMFAGLHPEEVVALVMIDIFKLRSCDPGKRPLYTRRAIDDLLKTEQLMAMAGEKPRTYEDIKKRLVKGQMSLPI